MFEEKCSPLEKRKTAGFDVDTVLEITNPAYKSSTNKSGKSGLSLFSYFHSCHGNHNS
jgi:hypothetical protein